MKYFSFTLLLFYSFTLLLFYSFTLKSFSQNIDLSKPIGEISGSIGATPTGGVNYSIPIFVSPGTNGIQPSLNLVYNSQSPEGIAGLGWNLSGLSVISRSGKNFYHNGKVQPVNYTTDDLFLLDGTKLNPLAGINGADGSVYATENESFAKIISNATTNPNNPSWFKVIGNDGTVMEYGNSTDSKFFADNGQNIMFWRLSKVTDVNGNFIEYKYETIGRDTRLKQILYTGNTNIGLQPYNFIDFTYAARTDANTTYDAGASISSSYVLKTIKVTHAQDDNNLVAVRKYVLNHSFDNIRTKLTEIIEYAGEETAPSLNSTTFTYGTESSVNVVKYQSQSLIGTGQDYFTGDFDGDGKADLLAADYVYQQGAKVYSGYSINKDLDVNAGAGLIYNASFLGSGVISPFINSDIGGLFSADYNKDGRDDVIFLKGMVNPDGDLVINSVVLKTTGSFNSQTGFYDVGTQTFGYPAPPTTDGYYQLTSASGKNFITGDFDGDGNHDYILIAKDYYTNKYKAFFTSPATNDVNREILNLGIGGSTNAQTVSEADRIIPIDFDGDGKNELLVVKDNNSYIISFNRLSAATGAFMAASILYTSQTINKNCRAFPGDFNGDRKTDFLVHYDNNTWGLLYGNGIAYDANASAFSFQKPVTMSGYEIAYSNKVIIADFNGDGKSDILHGYSDYIYANNTFYPKLALYYSRGKTSSNNFFYEIYNNTISMSFADPAVGDFNADGRADFISNNGLLDVNIVVIKPNGQEKLLTKIGTGHNVTTDFQYKLLTNKTGYPRFYERTVSLDDPSNQNPFNYVQIPMYALYKTTVADGIGGDNITEFNYENAYVHRAAKGLLGFEKVTSKNNVTGITSISQIAFNTQFAVPYAIKETKKITATNSIISESIIDNSFINLSTGYNDKRFLQHVDKTTSFDYLNGKAIEVSNTYDNYGNVINSINKIGFGTYNNITPIETSVTTTSYGIYNTNVPAKPDNIVESNTRVGKPTISKTNTFSYDILGRLISKIDYYGLPKAITTSLTYNTFGNVLTSVQNVTGLIPITNTNNYDYKGRFVLQKQISTGANAQTESFVIDTKWGVVLSNTTSDCLTNTFEYDAFGRLNKTTFPNGNFVTVYNTWQVSGNNLFYVTEHSSGGAPDKRKYFDKWGKTWKEEVASMASTNLWHTMLTTYDNRGNIKTKTNSFFPNVETARITTNNYDIYNRPTTTINYRGSTSFAYAQLGQGNMKLTVTNTDGNSSSQITDATGKTVISQDNGGVLNFAYNSLGNQTEVNNNGIAVVSFVYDIYGMQSSMADIDAGTTSYVYDNYNRLSSQTDAKGNTVSFTYDDLGRTLTRVGTEGTTTYEYYNDIATGCKNNSIKKVTGFNGIINEYTYDALKRLQSVTETGVSGDVASRITSYAYDGNSMLNSTTYPNGISVYNFYDANGYLIRKSTNSMTRTGGLLFYNPVIDGESRYKSYTLGNGKTTTKMYNNDFPATTATVGIQNLTYNFQANSGNLLQRNDVLRAQIENFTYDNLNRLRTAIVNGALQGNITYDGSNNNTMGNINTKTDAGYYTYLNTKKHAVAFATTTPTPTQSVVTPIPFSAISPTEQIINYTSFLKPDYISEGAPYGGPSISFEYGADYERVQTFSYLGRNPVERRYFAGDYEEQEKGTQYNRSLIYVSAGDGLCAILIKDNQTQAVSRNFVYTDYLGSILTVTNETGTIVANNNFDAWGRDRDPNNWNTYMPWGSFTNPTWLYRGYTGHEMLTNFSLINMNGRLYDPILGRMLSPDNYVAGANNTQGYNRYTYALNNPLVYTDPDGNLPFFAIAAVLVGGFVNGMRSDMSGERSFLGGFWRGAAVSAAGVALGGIGGGSLLGNVAWGVGQGVVVNGLSNILNGNPVSQGAGTAALFGGAFALLSSGMEAFRNWNDGYGFNTDRGALNRMVKDYNSSVGTTTEISKANRAMGFVQNRYGMDNANFIYDLSGRAEAQNAYAITTPDATNDILVDKSAFKNSSLLKSKMAHEYGHLMLDKIIKGGVFTGWTYPTGSYSNPIGNVDLANDGPLGWAQEVYNAGRLHLSPSFLKSTTNYNPLYNIWNPNKYGWRAQYILPRRFPTMFNLKFY